jgi:aspartate carbamoyltransferase catalytic subunit
LTTLGAEVVLCGPPPLLPAGLAACGARVTCDIDQAIEGADAVMMLRIQKERQTPGLLPAPEEYRRRWGMTAARAANLKENAWVLHPGPINRGLELDSEVADGPKSLVLEQVANGVVIRQAILEALA